MPAVGVPNNPTGINSWEGFTQEQPYGQATQQAQLAKGAPMAGGKVAAGALNSAKRAGRQAQKRPPKVPGNPVPPSGGVVGPLPPELTGQVPPLWPGVYDPGSIQNAGMIWQQLAATPGAERYPVIALMAQRAGAA